MQYRTTFRLVLLFAFILVSSYAQSLSVLSGNGQLVSEQFLSNAPLVVQAIDSSGKPAAGASITWAITAGSGTIAFADKTTDANGQATAKFLATSVNPGQSFFPSTVTATGNSGTASFIITTYAELRGAAPPVVVLQTPPLENRNLTGASGSTLPGAIVIQVAAQSGFQLGQGIPNVGLRLINNLDPSSPAAATCGGQNGVIFTDSTGKATCDVKLTGQPGTAQIAAYVGEAQTAPPINLTITQGVSCSYSLTATSQSFGANGGNGSVGVNATATCGWTATSNASWITFTSATSGVGSGNVAYTVTGNSGTARTGTMTIAGVTYTVSQAAAGTPNALAIVTAPTLAAGTVGTFYSTALSATGGTPSYSWSVSGNLPPGLSIAANNGVISGTPTTTGSYTFTGTVRDNVNATQSQTFSITINAAGSSTFSINNSSFPNGAVGQAYSQLLSATGGCVTPFSQTPNFSVSVGSLPAGLSLVTNSDRTFSIAGTPTVTGVSSFTLTATDACAHTASAGFTLTIGGSGGGGGGQVMTVNPLSLAFTVLAGTANIPADQNLAVTASSGTLNYSVSISTITGGSWLAIKTPVNGTTAGNITVNIVNFSSLTAGTYAGAVTITSTASNSPVSIPVTLTVINAPTLSISPLTFTVNQAASALPPITRQDIAVNNGASVTHFTATAATTSGGAWLAVSSAEGNTPSTITAIISAGALTPGTYTGTITVTPTGGVAQAVTVTLNILPSVNLIATPAPITFTVAQGAAVAQQALSVTSSGTAIAFSAQAASQGGWLSITPSSGTTPATFTVTVNPAGLAAGPTYSGLITLVPANSSIETLTVPVNLTLTAQAPAIGAVTNSASFAPGPVSPGELITIFGTGLGPVNAASLQLNAAGNVDTSLGGTQVLFDGIPAAMVYASATQVSAFVPYEIAGRANTQVQVQYQNVKSSFSQQRVIDAVPGIFVLDATGQGAILNQDTTVNSAANGALPGSFVSIYATGEGVTDPPVANGTVIGSIVPKPKLSVTVQIGGKSAFVTYAGSAPGEPAGVLQVNVQIPPDLPHGTAQSVVIFVGSAPSQAGVIVNVK